MEWIQAEEKNGFRPIPRGISAGEGSMTERRKEKENIWNVPNVLTLIRMGLIPVYWILMLNDHFYAAFAVFAAASLTDIADGFIARKYQLITNFGKLMDPLADKLMSISVMLSMAIKGIAPWAVLIILLCKEAVMVVGGVVLYRNDVVVYSIWIGKLAQTVVVLSLLSCFFHEWLQAQLGFPLHLYLLWAGVALSLAALAIYTVRALAIYGEVRKKAKKQ